MPFGFGNRGYGYGSGGRGRGSNFRWIIAIVIAVGAVIAYFGKTQVNPVTGEKQRVNLTEDQEIALGLEAAPQMAKQMGGAIDPNRDRGRVGWRKWGGGWWIAAMRRRAGIRGTSTFTC
jgi:hypothetical protein